MKLLASFAAGKGHQSAQPAKRRKEGNSLAEMRALRLVDVDLKLRVREQLAFLESVDDLNEDFDAGACHVELAATVVGEDDALDAGLRGGDSIFPG